MGHGDIRLTMNVYGGLMETVTIAHVEWIDDLLPKVQLSDVLKSTHCAQNVTAARPINAASVVGCQLVQ
jgi:hypothetical protein